MGNAMPYGPCNVCGATNYPSSMGGPYICPSCDCGNFNKNDSTMNFFYIGDRAFTSRDEIGMNKTLEAHSKRLNDMEKRLSKAEDLLNKVLNHNQLSLGQWVKLMLDIVEFNPKRD